MILAHNYQIPQIQDVADHVGDSLALSRIAATAPEQVIVFCGVHFMAETAKILSPDKTVLIPDENAGCSLADSLTAEQLRAWKRENPGAVVVSYVNTTAEVKAETDLCCTSSNAVDVVRSIPADTPVLFGPDQFLGAHVRRVLGRDNISVWGGECHVHAGINGRQLTAKSQAHPDADLYVHPECGCATSALYLASAGAVPSEKVKILSTGDMVIAARAAAKQVHAHDGAGRHGDRHAAPAAAGRSGHRLPRGERTGVVPVHEDDHSRQAARQPARDAGRGARRPGDRAAGARRRGTDDRDRSAGRRGVTRRTAFPPLPAWEASADIVVVGTGVAGLTAALDAARAGLAVLLVTKGEPAESSTQWAQGGVAVVRAERDDGDCVEAHVDDTLTAAAGLAEQTAVALILAEGPAAVARLMPAARRSTPAPPGWRGPGKAGTAQTA